MIRAYPKYKYSGAPWFGDVPDYWGTPRLGTVLRERKEVNKANEVTKILSVMRDVGVIPYEEKGNVGNKCSEDITRYKIVRPGDIVANCMNIIIGSVGISKYTGCLSPVYYVLTPRSKKMMLVSLTTFLRLKPFNIVWFAWGMAYWRIACAYPWNCLSVR
jgi:type I restriction enzyme S subunit